MRNNRVMKQWISSRITNWCHPCNSSCSCGQESIHFNERLMMANRSVPHLRELLHVIFFFIFMAPTSPFLLAFYLLCWFRAKVTALVYSHIGHTLMSGYDSTVGMEFNSNNTIMNSMMVINGHLSVEDLKDLTMNNVINQKDSNIKPQFPKFTSCLTLHVGYLFWSEKNNFDVDYHIRPFHGQPPRDETELKSVVNHMCNTPLDPKKPSWEIHVIPIEYGQTTGRRTCLLIRLHHSIADGISTYRLLIEQLGGNHGALKHSLKRRENKLQSNYKYKIATVLGQLKRVICSMFATPSIIYNHISFREGYQRQKIELSGVNIFDWTSIVKMSTIKDIKNATSTTVNDVIVSCLAGACRKHLLRQGAQPPNFLKSMMPITIHNLDGPVQLKNESMAVLHKLPTGDMDCIQRLQATKSIMDKLKRSPDAYIFRWFLKHCVNTVPYSIMKWLYDLSEFNVILSNIPGPLTKASFNGHVIDSCIGLAQSRVSCYFGLIALSYVGNLTVGVTVDTAIISTKEEAALLLHDFVQEVHQLYDSVIPAQFTSMDK